MGLFQWSLTSALNGNIDPLINWVSGIAPSAVTPSSRASMSVLAAYRNDTSGALRDTGVANAYILTSASNYNQMTGSQTALQTLGNNQIAFTPANANTGASTLSIDGLGPFPLRSSPNTELLPSALVAGTSYSVLFNPTDSAFYLQNYFGNLGIPLGGTLIWWDDVLPNSSFAWANGQILAASAVSPMLFARWGTRFGGNGVTTMGVPDLRSTVPMGRPTMGGIASRALGIVDTVLNTLFGEANHTLSAAEIPAIGVNVSVSGTLSGVTTSDVDVGISSENTGGGSFPFLIPTGQAQVGVAVSGSMSGGGVSNNTGGAAHNNVQPSTTCNFIVRVL
jgi:microcystin-dependent protein